MKPFRPMLAGEYDQARQRYPAIGSPKIDGVRCLAMAGKPMSRSMKVIPSLHVQKMFAEAADLIEGLDGELIVGMMNAPNVFSTTTSHVMAHDKAFDFTFQVFDLHNEPTMPYAKRLERLSALKRDGHLPGWVNVLPSVCVHNQDQMDTWEIFSIEQGFEGLILRDPDSLYKQGRSSTREGILIKVKRRADAEAEIIGFEELMHNGNEAFTSELGRTKRAGLQEHMVPMGTLGAFIMRGLPGQPFEGVTFNVGTGLDDSLRAEVWANRDRWLGKIGTYKFFSVGCKDKPRHPVWKGVRDPIDMGE